MEKSDKLFIGLLSLCAVVAIASTCYLFLISKKYSFTVEATCDPNVMTCFSRDCSNPDDCPPNGLEHYRQFEVSAKDFAKCSENSCLTQCQTGAIQCKEIKCGENKDDVCEMLSVVTSDFAPNQ